MGAVDDEESLDDGFADLVWPEVPAEAPVAGRDEEDGDEEDLHPPLPKDENAN